MVSFILPCFYFYIWCQETRVIGLAVMDPMAGGSDGFLKYSAFAAFK